MCRTSPGCFEFLRRRQSNMSDNCCPVPLSLRRHRQSSLSSDCRGNCDNTTSSNLCLTTTTTIHFVLVSLLVMVLALDSIECVLPPPKFLPRIVAGFYSFHPAYDSDKKAEVVMSESRPPIQHHHTYEQNGHLQSHDHKFVGHTNKHYHQLESIKQHPTKGYHYQYLKHNSVGQRPKTISIVPNVDHHHHHQHLHSSSSSNKDNTHSQHYSHHPKHQDNHHILSGDHGGGGMGHHHHNLFYWHQMSHILHQYAMMAEDMAKFYSKKYHYPADLLYWQIIEVMFPSPHSKY